MRRHRVLTIVVLLAFGGLSLGLGWEIYRRDRLPDPAQADGDALMRWLSTRELSEETPQIRQKLLRRLEWFLDEQDAEEPFELNEVLEQLDEDQTRQFWSNVYLLADLWFMERVERYDQLSEPERSSFLSKTIERVTVWGVLGWVPATDYQAADGNFAKRALAIRQQIQPWIDAHEDAEREKIERFLDGVKDHLLLQQLRRLLGS